MNKRKNFIALFLALATMASLAVTAVADVNDINRENVAVLAAVSGIDGISFGKDDKTGTEINGTLKPGNTYVFPVFITDEDGNTSQMTSDDVDNYNVTIKEKNGEENISSIQLVKKSNKYSLEIVTKSQWPTEKADVEYIFKIADKDTDKVIVKNTLEFKVGYNAISDDNLYKQAKDGGYIVVNNDAPVITEEQFQDIDDLVKGEKVTFSNDNWTYEVKVTSQGGVNMLNSNSAIKDVVRNYGDNQFEFVCFPGSPEFKFTGKLTISVADQMDDFDNFYVYKYENGKMVKVDSVLDKAEEALSINTKTLGNFVITDKEIKDGTTSSGNTDNGSTTDNNTTENDKTNPSTGSASMVGAAAAVAVTAAAGVVLSKKSK